MTTYRQAGSGEIVEGPTRFSSPSPSPAASASKAEATAAKSEGAPKPSAAKTEGSEARNVTAEVQNESGLAWKDEWDLTPEERAARAAQGDPNDPLAPFRTGKGHALEMPSSVMNYSEEDSANLSDFGYVAAREGWPREFAQAIVDQVAADFRSEKSRPGPEGDYDPQRTVTELRFEFGAETEAILGRVEAYCAKRAALSAYLDATGLGNSPAVIRLLAAVASDESIVTKAGAKKFVENLGKNEKYWNGDKLELAKAKIAFSILG
jgi:hypothetical protein